MAMSRGNACAGRRLAMGLIFTDGSRARRMLSVTYLLAGRSAPTCLLLDLRVGYRLIYILGSEECGTASPFGLAPITLTEVRAIAK